MKKKMLLFASLVAISNMNFDVTQAADVSTWAGLNGITENILLLNDIETTGTPQTVTIGGTSAQIINGDNHSLTGDVGYQIKVQTTPDLTIMNFGAISDGTEESHTFSYTNTDGDTVYKTISKSISGFNKAPIQPNTNTLTNLTIQDVVYKDNNGQILNVSLKNQTDTATIKDTVIYGNKINSGEISILNISKGTVDIDNLIFDSNQTKDWAGGLDFSGGTTTTIKNSIFQNNKSQILGTLQLSGGLVNIDNSQFINNSNQYYDGGAISVTSTMQNITNSTFKGNTAGEDGGAIWYAQLASSPYFVNDKFEENQADRWGGAMYIGGTGVSTGNIYTIGSDFKNNSSTVGGAICTYNSTFYAVDTDFTGNTADVGGAIYAEDESLNIFAYTKDVIFSGNTANDSSDTFNAGAAVYYDIETDENAAFNINAATNRKVIFDNTVAAYGNGGIDVNMNINKAGLSYNDIDGNPVTITNGGEIQFNDRVGDSLGNIFNINLWGGKLSIGQNETLNASIANPDGLINDNNFYVKGSSTLNTANGVIGEFAPNAFEIVGNTTILDYQFDIDLASAVSDKLVITNNEGTLRLAILNVITDDSDADELKIKYSDTNVNGVLKDDYTITTSTETYDVAAENDSSGSFVVFTATHTGGGLPSAIIAEADQYIITNSQDENITAWGSNTGNVITHDIDINGNGQSIYTENGLDGMVVSEGINVSLRNVKDLSGFNNALTNNGGTLSIVDSNITNNTGIADITNNSGSVIIEAATKEIAIGSDNTANALLSAGGTVDVTGSNKVTFNGNVTGTNDANMNISTDTTFNGDVSGMNISQQSGTVDIGNFSGADYTLDDGTLNLGESGIFAPDTFELNQGTVNIADESLFSPQVNIFNGGNLNAINGNVGSLDFNSLTLKNVINLAVDIDLNKEVMDRISASSVSGTGTIKVNQFNVLSDTEKPRISIPFASDNLKDRVSTDVKSIEGKIYKYNIGYDSKTGQFNIVGGGGNSDGYSPSVMASPVAAQLQGYLTQLNSYDEAFRNMDMYMLLPKKARQAMKLKNRVAINSAELAYNPDKTIYDDNTGWVRTHTTFENVPLKNGPKVSNVAYGTYFGGESKMYDLGHGWDGIWGLYAGYNGSHQSYNGVSMYQNGGTLGVLGMAYKGNFFQGLTINTGANGGEASTRYGNEDFAMIMAGIASKSGYNFEFKDGKFIIQPSLLLSYSFVNSFDYTNSAGVSISSDPLHAIQVEPNLKFIANLKNSWQPYASVGMVYNIMDKTHYMANDVSLPELSVKPYVKYGIGIRKSWGERFTGFFQTFLTHGGRNGVGLQIGFRWALGGNKKSNSNNL